MTENILQGNEMRESGNWNGSSVM